MDRPVLLDTHVWVWLMEGRAGVSPEAVKLMEQAGEESFLRVSVISAWEVGMLEARGRFRLTSLVRNGWSTPSACRGCP